MSRIAIMASRHSPFYSPLIACIAGGFLVEEGLEPSYAIASPDATVPDGLLEGSIQLGQLAVSASWGYLEKGVQPHFMHFAQINERDGFFLAARKQDQDQVFDWQDLVGRRVLVDHLGQPMALFKYAAAVAGLDVSEVDIVDCGEPDDMDAAFRAGIGDYIHQQGGAPQQLEKEGIATVVCALGDISGRLAFSSLAATPEWIASGEARAFMRGYRKARRYVIEAPAQEIAASEKDYFPAVDLDVLTDTIERYKTLGCWSPDVSISRESYAAALSVFQATGGIRHDHPFDQVVVAPPG